MKKTEAIRKFFERDDVFRPRRRGARSNWPSSGTCFPTRTPH